MTSFPDTSAPAVPVRSALDELVPHVIAAVGALDAAARRSTIENSLLELVRLRASQLNGCAYCVDLHSTDARRGGESERRLHALVVWEDTPFFSGRERAAIRLTEAMTRLGAAPVADEVLADVGEHFDERETAELIGVVTAINAWNLLGATARAWPLA